MKIKEKTIIKVSLILFILSFSLLLFIEKNVELELTPLSDISIYDLNTVVKTKAILSRQTLHNTTLFLTIKKDNITVPTILFDINSSPLTLGENYLFTGKVVYYKKSFELLLAKIEPIP